MYGFKKGISYILTCKVPHFTHKDSSGGLSVETGNAWEFTNANFVRDQPDLLYFISRKAKTAEGSEMDITRILAEMESIKKHSTSISHDLKNIQVPHLRLVR